MVDEPWRPYPGALVQIWDYAHVGNQPLINGHGQVGYVVKRSGGTDSYSSCQAGPIFEVIIFKGEVESIRHDVWHGWLREIKKSSDIKIVLDKT